MPTRRCCCGNCRLGEDDFNRADENPVSGSWHEISGDWEVKSNKLNCLTAGVLATTICHASTYTNGSYVMRCTLAGITDETVTEWEMSCGNPSSPNYVVEVLLNAMTSQATLKLYSGNKTSLIKEQTYDGVTADRDITICYAPGLTIDVSIGIPDLEFCSDVTGATCYGAGSDVSISQSGSVVTGVSIAGQADGTTLYGVLLRNEDGDQDSAILLFSTEAARAAYDIESSSFTASAGMVAAFTSTNSGLAGSTHSLTEQNSSGISGTVTITSFTHAYEFSISKGSTPVGGFAFRKGRFDDWVYDLHWLDLEKCEKCTCFCEKSRDDFKCYPPVLYLSFENTAGGAAQGTIPLYQSFLNPTSYPWPEKGAWYSEVQNCGSPVSAQWTARFGCGQEDLGSLAFGTSDYVFESLTFSQIAFSWNDSGNSFDKRDAIKASSTCDPILLTFPSLRVNCASPSPICTDPPCDTSACSTPYCTDLNTECYDDCPDIQFTPKVTE